MTCQELARSEGCANRLRQLRPYSADLSNVCQTTTPRPKPLFTQPDVKSRRAHLVNEKPPLPLARGGHQARLQDDGRGFQHPITLVVVTGGAPSSIIPLPTLIAMVLPISGFTLLGTQLLDEVIEEPMTVVMVGVA